MSKCHICGKRFKTEAAREQHSRDKHGQGHYGPPPRMSKEQAKAVMDEMDDLPDGAFFAMAEELGLETKDWLD